MIEVFANGLKFPYWTSATISRSVGSVAGSFTLNLASNDAHGQRLRLWLGDLVQIDLDGVPVLKGFVNKISPSVSSGSHSLTISGNEISCDLVKCGVEGFLEWKNKTADAIIQDICGRYGIGFFNPYNVSFGKPIKNFSVDPGATAVEAIGKLCNERGILPMSNGTGQIYVIKPSAASRGPNLQEGVNLLSFNADYSADDCFSDYFVFGTGKAKKKVQAHVQDKNVERYRPFILVDANATEKETVENRANWERNTRQSKSMVFKCSVQGWSHEGGLWKPGTICGLYAPSIFVDEPLDLLVSQVNYTFGNGGSVTNLSLVQPQSYEPQPTTAAIKSPKATTPNAWQGIKKAVKG